MFLCCENASYLEGGKLEEKTPHPHTLRIICLETGGGKDGKDESGWRLCEEGAGCGHGCQLGLDDGANSLLEIHPCSSRSIQLGRFSSFPVRFAFFSIHDYGPRRTDSEDEN